MFTKKMYDLTFENFLIFIKKEFEKTDSTEYIEKMSSGCYVVNFVYVFNR